MENLLLAIKKDRITAMKNKQQDKKNVLSTLLGEIDRIGKDISDETIIVEVKKLIKNNILTKCEAENVYLKKYLPKQLTEEHMKVLIEDIIKDHSYYSMKHMGLVITIIKSTFPGQIDAKVLAKIVKERLS